MPLTQATNTGFGFTPIPQIQPQFTPVLTATEILNTYVASPAPPLNMTPITLPPTTFAQQQALERAMLRAQTPQPINAPIQPAEGIPSATPQQAIDRFSKQGFERARHAAAGQLALGVAGAALQIGQSIDYKQQVKSTRGQYDAQQKIMDANMLNQQSLMIDNLNENMAQLDAITAAKNVDITSGGITAAKQKGATNLGQDIRNMQEANNLNRLAMDLDYRMNVARATGAANASIMGAFTNVGFSAYNYFGMPRRS